MANTANQLVAVVEHFLSTIDHCAAGQTLGYGGKGRTVGCRPLVCIACDDVTSDQAIAIETGIGIVPCRVFNNRVTITGGQIVKELITMQYHSEFGAIGLCNQPGCRVGGDCSSGHAQQSHGE